MRHEVDIRNAVVAEARRWIGTPYAHQASCLGAGTDCLGLLRGIWRALYGAEPMPLPPYSADWDAAETMGAQLGGGAQHEAGAQQGVGALEAAMDALFPRQPLGRFGPGDVVLFRMRAGRVAKHLGVISTGGSVPRFVHAYSRHAVLEQPLSTPWQRRIVARFAWPDRTRRDGLDPATPQNSAHTPQQTQKD